MWRELAEYARWAPSPHNTQPTRLRIVDGERAEVQFVAERGLPVGDPQGKFTHMTFGIFVETLRIAAHARGHELEVAYTGEPLYRDRRPLQKVAELRLLPRGQPIEDIDPELILRRRTNRHPYNNRPVLPEVLADLRDETRRHGHAFHTSTDPRAIQSVKELNRDSLYHDLAHAEYREELDSWLRYSDAEAARTGDGLSTRTLVLPSWLMKGVMRAHWLFSAPVIEQVTKRVYMRTMKGISTVGWIQGDFVDAEDWTAAGHLMMRLWLVLTGHGVDWQPYGSIITNDDSRRSMVEKFGMEEGDGGRDMVWLLVRMGYCDHEPARSQRLALAEVLR
ncbi:MAG: hypothetical protein H0V19_05680 [Euzebyales bacterium]|nr:hypothetical protein [Euzebyales bacterium]